MIYKRNNNNNNVKKKTGHIQGKKEKDFVKVFKTHRIH